MNMKNFFTLIFSCFIFFTSFGQDSTSLLLNSHFKFHLSTGGVFLKNIETEFLESSSPLIFVEGGIEVGQRFNFEIIIRQSFGSIDTLNLNFTQVHLGVNNKSQLKKDLSMVMRVGGGFVIVNGDYMIRDEVSSLDVRFLRIGVGLEQKLSKGSVMTFNVGYDISNESLFNGLGVSVGVKIGFPHKEGKNVPYI